MNGKVGEDMCDQPAVTFLLYSSIRFQITPANEHGERSDHDTDHPRLRVNKVAHQNDVVEREARSA